MKILLLDIETSPNTAYVWGMFKQNLSISSLIESSGMLCWAAKWMGEDEIFFDSIQDSPKKRVVKGISKLLSEADVVITYNGNRFDLPVLNKEFLLEGLSPPSPYKSLDLYTTVKRQFRFTSNKLDYIAQQLELGKKNPTNFQLWVDCMNKDPIAWAKMKSYNIQDVILLESVYHKIKCWIKNPPNHNLYQPGDHVCPTCGSHKVQKRGFAYTIAQRYQRYQCTDCGSWSRGSKKNQESLTIKGIN